MPFDEPPIAWSGPIPWGSNQSRSFRAGIRASHFRNRVRLRRISRSAVIPWVVSPRRVQRSTSWCGSKWRRTDDVALLNRISRATILMLDFSSSSRRQPWRQRRWSWFEPDRLQQAFSYWIMYDHLRLEVLPTNAPPKSPFVENQTADEGVPLIGLVGVRSGWTCLRIGVFSGQWSSGTDGQPRGSSPGSRKRPRAG